MTRWAKWSRRRRDGWTERTKWHVARTGDRTLCDVAIGGEGLRVVAGEPKTGLWDVCRRCRDRARREG